MLHPHRCVHGTDGNPRRHEWCHTLTAAVPRRHEWCRNLAAAVPPRHEWCRALAAAVPPCHEWCGAACNLAAAVPRRQEWCGAARTLAAVPSLAKACHYIDVNGSRYPFNACKRLNRPSATLVEACDAVIKQPAGVAGEALGRALMALSEGRDDLTAMPTRDVDAACALARVYRAHTDACKAASAPLSEVPKALAAGCRAARRALLENGSFVHGDPVPVPAPPVVVVKATPAACELLRDSGYASRGPIIQAFNGASELWGRACTLSGEIVNRFSMAARQGYTPVECRQLDAQCNDMKRNQQGAKACALTRTPILFDVCQATVPPAPCTLKGQGQYASRCLDAFREGKTTYKVAVMVDRRPDLWLEGTGRPEWVIGTEDEAEVRDCCKLLDNECLCKMRKDLIKEGNAATVGCLNKKELLSCK